MPSAPSLSDSITPTVRVRVEESSNRVSSDSEVESETAIEAPQHAASTAITVVTPAAPMEADRDADADERERAWLAES